MSKFITVGELIEILSKIDPTIVIAVEHDSQDCTSTVYTLVESDCIKVEDDCFVLDIR